MGHGHNQGDALSRPLINMEASRSGEAPEPRDIDVLCASVHVYNAYRGLHEDHKTDRVSLDLYMFCQSSRYKVLLVGAVVAHLALALFEAPALVEGVPGGVTEVVELALLIFYTWDLSMRARYLVDRRRLYKDKKYAVVITCMALILVDLIISAGTFLMTGSAGTRWSRVLRPWFLVYAHQPLRLVVRDLRRTLPDVVEVLALLFGVIMLFAVVFYVLVGPNLSTADVITSGDRTGLSFDSFPHSIIATIVLLSTANFPDVMMPAYNHNRINSLFFIAFLVLALYLIMSLVLAIFYIKYRYHLKVEVRKLLLVHSTQLELAWKRLDPGATGTIPLVTWRRLMRKCRAHASKELHILLWDLLRTESVPLTAKSMFTRAGLSPPTSFGGEPNAASPRRDNGIKPRGRRAYNDGDSLLSMADSCDSESAASVSAVYVPPRTREGAGAAPASMSASGSSSGSASGSSSAPLSPLSASAATTTGTVTSTTSTTTSSALGSSSSLSSSSHRGTGPPPLSPLRSGGSAATAKPAGAATPGDGGMTFSEFSKIVDVLSADVRERPRILTRYDAWYRRPVDTIIKRAIVHQWFDYLVVFVIIANAATIVWDTSRSDNRPEANALWVMAFFSGLFIVEVFLRIYAVGLRYFASEWNRLDVFVLIVSVLDLILMTVLYLIDSTTRIEPGVEQRDDTITALWRVGAGVRLIRLACGFGKIRRFRVIIETLLEIGPLLVTCALLQFVLYYAYSIVGMELFGTRITNECGAELPELCGLADSGYATQGYYLNNFSDLVYAMTTLFELMVVNQWHVLAGGFIQVTSEWAWIYFISFYLCAVTINLNIIVALILEAFVLLFKIKGEESGAMERLRGRLAEIDSETTEAARRVARRLQRRDERMQTGSAGPATEDATKVSVHAAARFLRRGSDDDGSGSRTDSDSDSDSETTAFDPEEASAPMRWTISLKRSYNAFIQQLFLAELQQGTTVGIEAPGASFAQISSRTEIALDLNRSKRPASHRVVRPNMESPLFATSSSGDLTRSPRFRSRTRRKTWLPEDSENEDDI